MYLALFNRLVRSAVLRMCAIAPVQQRSCPAMQLVNEIEHILGQHAADTAEAVGVHTASPPGETAGAGATAIHV